MVREISDFSSRMSLKRVLHMLRCQTVVYVCEYFQENNWHFVFKAAECSRQNTRHICDIVCEKGPYGGTKVLS